MTGVYTKGHMKTTHRENAMRLSRQRLEWCVYKPGMPRIVGNHQKLEEAWKRSSLEPVEGARPSWHHDFSFQLPEWWENTSLLFKAPASGPCHSSLRTHIHSPRSAVSKSLQQTPGCSSMGTNKPASGHAHPHSMSALHSSSCRRNQLQRIKQPLQSVCKLFNKTDNTESAYPPKLQLWKLVTQTYWPYHGPSIALTASHTWIHLIPTIISQARCHSIPTWQKGKLRHRAFRQPA